MPRVPAVAREDLPPEKRYVADMVMSRRGPLGRTIFPLLLNHPDAAEKVADLGAYIQFSQLSPIAKQIGILTASMELHSEFIWNVRQPMAQSDGVRQEVISALREGESLDHLNPDESVLIRFARELLRDHTAGEMTFEAAHKLLGTTGLIDYSLLVGFYAMIIPLTNALGIASEPDVTGMSAS
jgi:4-carboxymuconolactone decarboxylase